MRRTKFLWLILVIVVFLAISRPLWGPNYDRLFNTQARHLQEVDAHIRLMEPAWEKFQSQHEGFEEIKFASYTGGDGVFGVFGTVATSNHFSLLREFIKSNAPPRRVYFNVLILDEMKTE